MIRESLEALKQAFVEHNEPRPFATIQEDDARLDALVVQEDALIAAFTNTPARSIADLAMKLEACDLIAAELGAGCPAFCGLIQSALADSNRLVA